MTLASDATFASLVDQLAYRFAHTSPRDEVAAVVARIRGELEPTSRHPEFLPVLVEHAARDHLTSLARRRDAGGETIEILFVCLHNEGRSQMAAAIADHLSGDQVHVRSAGIAPTGLLNETVVAVLAERGIELAVAYPTPIEDDVLAAPDVVVTMGADLDTLPGRHHVSWDVTDPHHKSIDEVRAIRDDIERRVVDLLVGLGVHVDARPGTTDTPNSEAPRRLAHA